MQWHHQKFTLKRNQLSLGLLLLACSFFISLLPTDIAAISSASLPPPSQSPPPTVPVVKCKNEQGKDVDWFIVYKLPKNRTSSNALVRVGLAYAFIVSSGSIKFSQPTGNKTIFSENNSNVRVEHRSLPGNGRKERERIEAPTPTSTSWTLSDKGIDSPESMVGITVQKLFAKDRDTAFLTYNDQPPVGPTTFSGGHTKGIIITSLASGFWIQHSVPHFPLIGDNYRYPDTGTHNGQIFHCISLPSSTDVDNLGKILDITKPHIVNFSLPTDAFKQSLPQLNSIVSHYHANGIDKDGNNMPIATLDNYLIKGSSPQETNVDKISMNESPSTQSPCVNEVNESACLIEQLDNNNTTININNKTIQSTSYTSVNKKDWDLLQFRGVDGRLYSAYVKGPSYNEDIYSAWIAPTYKAKLTVQSWLNGIHPFPSNCTLADCSVYNIDHKSIAGHPFSTHNDHSKWTISAFSDQHLVCISDLNRMEHQLKRGGAAICFTDTATWMTFNSSVIDLQPCPTLVTGGGTRNDGGREEVSAASSLVDKNKTHIYAGFHNQSQDELDEKSTKGNVKPSQYQEHYRLPQVRHQNRKVKSRTFSFGLIDI